MAVGDRFSIIFKIIILIIIVIIINTTIIFRKKVPLPYWVNHSIVLFFQAGGLSLICPPGVK